MYNIGDSPNLKMSATSQFKKKKKMLRGPNETDRRAGQLRPVSNHVASLGLDEPWGILIDGTDHTSNFTLSLFLFVLIEI